MIKTKTGKFHMCINIDGLLRNYQNKRMDGLFDNEDGSPVSHEQALKYLNECKEKGWNLLPMGDCDNFDYIKDGCLGHNIVETEKPEEKLEMPVINKIEKETKKIG